MDFYADVIGYFALALNLYSMSVKSERRLRAFAMVANGLYILYGILIGATPIILGCTVAVLLHGYRLHQMKIDLYGRDTIGH